MLRYYGGMLSFFSQGAAMDCALRSRARREGVKKKAPQNIFKRDREIAVGVFDGKEKAKKKEICLIPGL